MSNLAKIQDVVADQLGKDAAEVTAEKKFIDDLGADSLDLAELVIGLEEAFDIEEISEEDSEKFVTVQDVLDFIEKQ